MKRSRSFEKNYVSTVLLLIAMALTFTNHTAKASTQTAAHDHEIVVLIHGLMRTAGSMDSLQSYLRKQGYEVYSYSYMSFNNTIHEHSMSLHTSIEKLLQEHPGTKVAFVTHSMGGIIAREALAQLSPNQLKQIACLVMLAPPSQGSSMAKVMKNTLPMVTHFIKPLAELSSDKTSYVHQVPIPKVKIGIIAGRFDAKSPPAAVRLDGQAEPVIVNAAHTFIMNNSQAQMLVARFLEKGSFE